MILWRCDAITVRVYCHEHLLRKRKDQAWKPIDAAKTWRRNRNATRRWSSAKSRTPAMHNSQSRELPARSTSHPDMRTAREWVRTKVRRAASDLHRSRAIPPPARARTANPARALRSALVSVLRSSFTAKFFLTTDRM